VKTTTIESEVKVAEALEQIRATALTFFGEGTCSSSSETAVFNDSLSTFIRRVPCKKEDFKDGYWSGNLSITWKFDKEGSRLVVRSRSSQHQPIAEMHSRNNKALMFKITPQLLYIVALSVKHYLYNELHITGFEEQNARDDGVKPPAIEDVFQAFSKAGTWKQNLKKIVIDHSYMNAVGDDFELVGEYPEALEDMHVCWPSNRGGVESSTVYKVASRAKKLKVLSTGGSGGTDMILTKMAVDFLCVILANTNYIKDIPSETYRFSSDDFDRVLKALAKGHSRPPAQPKVREWTKYGKDPNAVQNAQYSLAKLYFSVNNYRAFFCGGAETKAIAPFVLEHCQKKRTGYDCGRSVLFYVLRENAARWVQRPSTEQKGRPSPRND